jgi:hypothetical protein
MTLYSHNKSYPQSLPHRIRLSNGLTRTDPTSFTPEEIADAGYVQVDDQPTANSVQKVYWDSDRIQWVLEDKTLEELQAETNALWNAIRQERDKRIAAVTWRYERYARHARLGIEQIDNIEDLDAYIQALADIPQNQTDPYDIVWPVLNRRNDNAVEEVLDDLPLIQEDIVSEQDNVF